MGGVQSSFADGRNLRDRHANLDASSGWAAGILRLITVTRAFLRGQTGEQALGFRLQASGFRLQAFMLTARGRSSLLLFVVDGEAGVPARRRGGTPVTPSVQGQLWPARINGRVNGRAGRQTLTTPEPKA